MDSLLTPVFIVPLLVIVLLFLVAATYARNYVKVPPNKVAVFTGRGQPKVVRGGARFRVPVLERVDFMELEPFNVQVVLQRAYSSEGVPVGVEAVGLMRFGSDDTSIQTAVERFLTMNRSDLHAQLNEILSGSLRGIVAKMTVEELNGNREELARSVISEAGDALSKIGMELDVLTVQNVADANGYLDSLGRKRIAEVKRDADIGEADAERETKVRSAEALRQGEVAEAEAATAIAEAQRARDIKLAKIDAEVKAEQARAAQAGPLADAEAKKAVGVANEQAEAARVEARIAVEERDIIAPADAARQAAIATAEGQRQASILAAQAEAESKKAVGNAEAEARKAAASALREEKQAEADGVAAGLKAEAEGQEKMAESLNSFSAHAIQLQLAPLLMEAIVQGMRESAQQLGNIDNITIIGGGGENGGGAFGGLQDTLPQLLAKMFAVFEASGIDVSALVNQAGVKTMPAAGARQEVVMAPVATSEAATADEASTAAEPSPTDQPAAPAKPVVPTGAFPIE
jgi:flotillin